MGATVLLKFTPVRNLKRLSLANSHIRQIVNLEQEQASHYFSLTYLFVTNNIRVVIVVHLLGRQLAQKIGVHRFEPRQKLG